METKHFDETFNDICIEKEFEDHFFKECTFDGCYLEVSSAIFNNCKFKDCYIYTKDKWFVDCEYINSLLPLCAV